MNTRNRRLTDQSLKARATRFIVHHIKDLSSRIGYVLSESDMSLTLLLGGLGLIAWAWMGNFTVKGWKDLEAYASMFPMGSAIGWLWVYVVAGTSLAFLSLYDMPKYPALLIGPFVGIVWAWAFFARSTNIATYQTGNATSMIYMAIGLLIVYRAGGKK